MRRKGRKSYTITPGLPFVVSLRTAQSVYEGAQDQTTPMAIPVDRSGNIGYPGRVQFGILGYGNNPATASDFGGAYPSDFIDFGPNDMTVNISITVHGNNDIDGDRQFVVSLNAPTTEGGSGQAAIGIGSIICTIIDDDAAQPTSNVEYGGNEAYYNSNPSDYSG